MQSTIEQVKCMSDPPETVNCPLQSDRSTVPIAAPISARPTSLRIVLVTAPVLALAFLLASFPANNSEVWRHLATGRALFSGTYRLGTDPFAYTTEGTIWANPSWLFDAGLYVMHLCLGEHLVVFKTLIAVGLSIFMLLGAGWPKRLWTASFSVSLGLICLGPHLVLTPTIVSYLLLAFTLWWLQRSYEAARPDSSLAAHLPLFVAFVLWANCDEWFLLGPITVGLFWLGSSGETHPAQRFSWTIPLVSLAVCLLNPHHVRIFRLPVELGTWPLAQKNAGSGMDRLLALSWPDIPVPMVAYVLLAGLCLLALVANRAKIAWPEVFVGTALLALSLYRSAAIPFFVIAASTILARNWQAARERRTALLVPSEDRVPAFPRFVWLGTTVGIAALWGLAILACPGWLQGSLQPRGWHLHPDPSMKQLAQKLANWHEQGQLGERSRSFNLSADVAHYVEWFCPQEKVFLDSRANLFPPEVVAEFQQVGNVLAAQTAAAAQPSDWSDARLVLDRWRCTHLLVADPADRRLGAAIRNLWQRPDEWTLVDLHGRSTVFVWTRPLHGNSPLDLPGLDLHQRAFAPMSDWRAPRQGINREPQPRAWWDCFAWSVPDGELDRDEAVVDIVHFEATRTAHQLRDRRIWGAELGAALLATIGPHNSGTPSVAGFQPVDQMAAGLQPLLNPQGMPLGEYAARMISARTQNSDQGPAGSLLLAVRAARRAIHDNPDDALAHLRLGRAYQALQQQTMEHGLNDRFPLLEQLRKVQTLVALKRAVHLQPDLLAAHELLANICLDARGFDLALPHVQERLRLAKAAGSLPNETPQEFTARINNLADHEQQLGKQVRELLNVVDTQSFDFDVYRKAMFAESKGLPGHALDQLLRSNDAEFGREGAILQLYLLLHAGRAADFRLMNEPAHEAVMGTFNYHWLQTLISTADGNYDQADEHLQRLFVPAVDSTDRDEVSAWRRLAHSQLLGLQMLGSVTNNPPQLLLQASALGPWQRQQSALLRRSGMAPEASRLNADLHTLQGLLALETGGIETAQQAFRQALSDYDGAEGSPRLARHYLRLIPARSHGHNRASSGLYPH